MDLFTPRNVAKFIVKTLVAGKVSAMTEDAITNYTHFEEDDTVVHIASGVVGWYISDKLKPYTDNMVDKTADWLVARKDKKNQKDTTE